MLDKWKLIFVLILAYYLAALPYLTVEEEAAEQVHRCVYSEGSCTEVTQAVFFWGFKFVGEEGVWVFLRVFALVLFFGSTSWLASALCDKLGKDTAVCYYLLMCLQFSTCYYSSRLSSKNYCFILGCFFCGFLIKGQRIKAGLIALSYLIVIGESEESYFVFQEVSPVFFVAGFLTFSNSFFDFRLVHSNLAFPLLALFLPLFHSPFLLPYLTVISAWGLNKMTSFKLKNDVLNLALTVLGVFCLAYSGFSALSTASRADFTEIKTIIEFKNLYLDMQKQDSRMPNPHVLLTIPKVPNLYLHKKDWIFDYDSLEKSQDFTHIISYEKHVKGFKILFVGEFSYFSLRKVKTVTVQKVYVLQRDDIRFSKVWEKHKCSRSHP